MRSRRIDNLASSKFEKRIIKKFTRILVTFILIVFSIFLFLIENKTKNIKYQEYGNIDYNIELTDNEFFKEGTLPANNQYISSIINTINLDFKYKLQMKSDFNDYKYKYKIEAQTKIIEKSTQNDIYNIKEILKEEEIVKSEDNKDMLDSNIAINYRNYDTIVKKLINAYDLNNVDCKTIVTFYVDLVDENDEVKNTSTMKVNVPLNVKTVNVETENSIDNLEEKDFVIQQNKNYSMIFAIITIILVIYEIMNITNIIKDIKRNCPKEIVEKLKLKKILREYHPYIQKINNKFDMTNYTVMRIESFDDMIRIREVVQNPILMFENETETKTYFIITTSTSILYVYEVNYGDVKEINN